MFGCIVCAFVIHGILNSFEMLSQHYKAILGKGQGSGEEDGSFDEVRRTPTGGWASCVGTCEIYIWFLYKIHSSH